MAAAHREALLDQAGKLFRAHGFADVSLADVAKAAGMTHGAIYGHFASKNALAAESVHASLDRAASKWRRRADRARQAGVDPLEVIIHAYLSPSHRNARQDGCAIAALGQEMCREDERLGEALRAGTEALIAVLQEEIHHLDSSLGTAECRDTATTLLAIMTGGLLLARVLAADPIASDAILQRTARLARASAPPLS